MSDKMNQPVLNNPPTRRQAIVCAAIAFSALALTPTEAWAAAEEEISRTEESIHLEPFIKASRKRLYEALMDTSQFNKVTQLSAAMQSGVSLVATPTQISPEIGGTFSLFGGHIVGRHIELVPNERIVQAWRVVDWAPGTYSLAKFELVEQGSGTKILFDHIGFPKGQAAHLAAGWKGNYWEPLDKFLT
jgi:activator of HSP90 ATPase